MDKMSGLSTQSLVVSAREIHPTWNAGLIAASVAVSLLGAFTSTQLICQAWVSRDTLATLVWTMLASLTFGFCSIWSLHFVAMLACELDVPIGLNIPLTILSAVLAVMFTFISLAADTVRDRYVKQKRRKFRERTTQVYRSQTLVEPMGPANRESTELLLEPEHDTRHVYKPRLEPPLKDTHVHLDTNGFTHPQEESPRSPIPPVPHYTDSPDFRADMPELNLPSTRMHKVLDPQFYQRLSVDSERCESDNGDMSSTTASDSRRSSGFSDSDASFGLGQFTNFRPVRNKAVAGKSVLEATALVLWMGLTFKNLVKGFVWSLAITLMHYLGIMSMRIPEGYFVLHSGLVFLSAVISWIVCCVGCILMASMETRLGQQLLFAVVASCGVAAMHYTGMSATTFYTSAPPSQTEKRGYPPSLPIAIASIAIVTCLAANGLLAHSATVARNKLAEIVRTRRRLWAAIAQKEHAEAAAMARSEFIASASHEIRTPLHQLQGYSDLMARCPLPEDARLLLFAIQDATKTLSLITNNVLDWSRLEKGEAVCRPINLDVRAACDSIVKLLPRRDDDLEVELFVAVSPAVPKLLLLDETYLHRIIMNLVSNALKFTISGYISLMLEVEGGKLVITVTDTGIGIPKSFLPELFEPFKQAQTRGAERGTGLGLSIVKQLLEKIGGDIETESRHRDAEGVGAARCGTKFVVRMPIEDADTSGAPYSAHMFKTRQPLAMFGNSNPRARQGVKVAWEKFGVDAFTAEDVSSLTEDVKYACVDIKLLQQNEELRTALSSRTDMTVLVPYDADNLLVSVLGTDQSDHFIPMRRPWIFHNMIPKMLDSRLRPNKTDFHRTVRFASQVDVVSASTSEQGSEPTSGATSGVSSPELENKQFDKKTAPVVRVLLVEDNKINQKLGAKMLKILGYEVLLAADGQEGIDMLMANQRTIDIILMDQSMPVKDGLTATREIREMEREGKLIGATRWQHSELRRNRRPIIAVTAVVGPSHEEMCKVVGTDAFLPKPLSLSKLRETLEEYLSETDGTIQGLTE